MCPDVVFMATPPVDGSFCEYVAHPADFAYKLPDNVSLEEGALFEPLSVGIHAVRRAGVGPGGSVLISGAGPIGLTALLAARAAGVSSIIISDVVPGRLDLARRLGATAIIDARTESVVDAVLALTDGLGVDSAIECSGAPVAQEAGILSLKRGGTLVLVGLGSDRLDITAAPIGARELDVRGVFRYANTYPAAVKLAGSGAVDLKPLVSHHFDLAEANRAIEMAHSRAAGVVKVVVHPTTD
jgi:L-iditol 2-dehydrogenase